MSMTKRSVVVSMMLSCGLASLRGFVFILSVAGRRRSGQARNLLNLSMSHSQVAPAKLALDRERLALGFSGKNAACDPPHHMGFGSACHLRPMSPRAAPTTR